MEHSFFPDKGVWLKGNTHSHSTVSDGLLSPGDLAAGYMSKGYDFLSLTDHNQFVRHGGYPPEKIILLTGVEHDIEYDADHCIHVIGIADSSAGSTGYACRRYSKNDLTAQQLIDMMLGDGQFVSIAHPYWSRMEPDELCRLRGCHAVEVYNNGAENLCHGGNAEILWDYMLKKGIRINATAVDDVHVPIDLYGGWIWAKASGKNSGAVMEALFKGAYYSTCGPRIYDFGIKEDKTICVSCSDCEFIHIITYPPRGKSFRAPEGRTINSADYRLTGRESFVRLVCTDRSGKSAWSNPVYF